MKNYKNLEVILLNVVVRLGFYLDSKTRNIKDGRRHYLYCFINKTFKASNFFLSPDEYQVISFISFLEMLNPVITYIVFAFSRVLRIAINLSTKSLLPPLDSSLSIYEENRTIFSYHSYL